MELIPAKSILSQYRDQNPWFGIHYNMNIYKGCSHGCIYCDSRSDCYKVEEFDRVRAKENALVLIEKELRSKRKWGIVGTGAMSDPYNPMEKLHQLTRGALEAINRQGYGVAIATKSQLIERDTDILKKIAEHSPVLISITITAAEDGLSRKLEPNCSLTSERFELIKKLSMAGLFVGVLLMPVLPFIEDTKENIGGIINRSHQSGAKFIYPAFGVTLRDSQRDYFFNQLDVLFPGLKEKYLTAFGYAYNCSSPNARMLWHLLEEQCQGYGIRCKMKDIINGYQSPYEERQLKLF